MSNDPILNSYEVTQPEGDGGKRLEITADVRTAFQTALDVPSKSDLTEAAVPNIAPQVILGNPGDATARATSVPVGKGVRIDDDGMFRPGGDESWRLKDLYFAARTDNPEGGGSGTYLDPYDVSTPEKFDAVMTTLYTSGAAANLYFAAGHYYINPIRPHLVHPVVNGVYAPWYWGNAWFLHGEGMGRTVFHFADDSNLPGDATGSRILLRSSRKAGDAGFASLGCIKNITIDGGVTDGLAIPGPSTTYRWAFDLDVGVFAVENVEFIRLGGRGQEMFYFILGNGLPFAGAVQRQAITVTGCKSDELYHDGYSGGGFLIRSLNPGHHQRLLAYNNTFRDAYWCAKDYWHIDHDLETVDSGRSNYGCYNYDTGSCQYLSFTRLKCTNGGSTQNLTGCITIGSKAVGLDTVANNWKHITIDDIYCEMREGSPMVCPAIFIAGGGVDDLKIRNIRIKKVTGQPAYGVIFYDTLLTDTIYYPGYGVPNVYPAPSAVVPNGAIREYWGNTVVDDGSVPLLLPNQSVGTALIAGVNIAGLARPTVANYSGSAVTLQPGDLAKRVRMTHFANSTAIVPAGLADGSANGKLEVYNVSHAPRLLVAGDDVTLNGPDSGLAIGKGITAYLTEVSPDEWDVAFSGGGTAPAAGAPVVATPPTVAGFRVVGQLLTVTPAEWEDDPDSVTRQWYRDQTPISGATGLTYLLVEADAGSLVSVLEVGINEAGSTYSGSTETEEVELGMWLDSVDGNDARTGLGPSQSVKTPTRLMQLIPDATDKTVVAVNGSLFLEQLTLTGNRLKIYGAGAGSKARFSCLAPISAFTKTAGKTNVYECDIVLTGDVSAKGNVWADGLPMGQVSSISAVDGTPNSAYVVDWTAVNTKLYVHAPGSAVPITDGKVYTYSKRNHGILATGDDIFITGVSGDSNLHQGGSIKMVGLRPRMYDVECLAGNRHACFVQDEADIDTCTFAGYGANPLESPFYSNTIVCNMSDVVGKTWRTRNCTFGDNNVFNLTGPLQHGANPNDLFLLVEHIDDTFIQLASAGSLGAEQTNIVRPVFVNNRGGFTWAASGNNVLIRNGTGSTCQLTAPSAGDSVICQDNILDVPTPGFGTSIAVHRYDSGFDDVDLTLLREKYTILARVGNANQLIRWCKGKIKVNDTEILPKIANPLDLIFNCGINGGTCEYDPASGGNIWPFGASFTWGGLNYRTLAAFQAAGFETGSSTAVLSSLWAFDDFAGASGLLDARAGWTLAAGTASTMGVNGSGMAGSTVATSVKSLYQLYNAPTPDFRVEIKLGTIPAGSGPFLAFRAIDESNSIRYRASTTNHIVTAVFGGVTTTIFNVAGLAPAAGDTIVIVVKGNLIWMYVNGYCPTNCNSKAIDVPGLLNATKFGFTRDGGALFATFADSIGIGPAS